MFLSSLFKQLVGSESEPVDLHRARPSNGGAEEEEGFGHLASEPGLDWTRVLPIDLQVEILLRLSTKLDVLRCSHVNSSLRSVYLKRNIWGRWLHFSLAKDLVNASLLGSMVRSEGGYMYSDPLLDPPSSVSSVASSETIIRFAFSLKRLDAEQTRKLLKSATVRALGEFEFAPREGDNTIVLYLGRGRWPATVISSDGPFHWSICGVDRSAVIIDNQGERANSVTVYSMASWSNQSHQWSSVIPRLANLFRLLVISPTSSYKKVSSNVFCHLVILLLASMIQVKRMSSKSRLEERRGKQHFQLLASALRANFLANETKGRTYVYFFYWQNFFLKY